MKLTLDTEATSDKDIDLIKEIYGLYEQKELNNAVEQTKKAIKQAKTGKIKPLSQKEAVLLAIKRHDSLRAYEVSKYVEIKEDNVSAILSILQREGKLDSSTTRPKRYFLKGKDPEINSMLRPGTKGEALR